MQHHPAGKFLHEHVPDCALLQALPMLCSTGRTPAAFADCTLHPIPVKHALPVCSASYQCSGIGGKSLCELEPPWLHALKAAIRSH